MTKSTDNLTAVEKQTKKGEKTPVKRPRSTQPKSSSNSMSTIKKVRTSIHKKLGIKNVYQRKHRAEMNEVELDIHKAFHDNFMKRSAKRCLIKQTSSEFKDVARELLCYIGRRIINKAIGYRKSTDHRLINKKHMDAAIRSFGISVL